MDSLVRDLLFGSRMLARRPAFSILAVLMIAIGIGTNKIVFSAVDAWLLKPLPFRDPQRLVAVRESESTKSLDSFNLFTVGRHFQDWGLLWGLILVGLLACYLPARRATKVDPILALRHE